MAEKEQTFRTSAFHTQRPGSYRYKYWIMSPAYGKPGFQIKEHEEGVNCAGVNRIADELPAREALREMDVLERKAAASLRRVESAEWDKLGPDYQAAESYAPYFDALVAETNYGRLRRRRPTSPSFRLKKP
jgi:hypothetical protein